jgi:uridine phosphorylase
MSKDNLNQPKNIPILDHSTREPSAFLPENLLAQAANLQGRQQSGLPPCCLLDFDGELISVAQEHFAASPLEDWACFHTSLLVIEHAGLRMGLIGGTVGAPFAVLVSEQLIASGCRHIIGYSSAGAVAERLELPSLVIPERALRDEGTSYHYLPPAEWIEASGQLSATLAVQVKDTGLQVQRGATWTTDAPYRETPSQIARHRAAGVLTVEMESAALMALAQVKKAEIASLLHVTNALATGDNDFHKGPETIHEQIINCCLAAFRSALTGREAI